MGRTLSRTLRRREASLFAAVAALVVSIAVIAPLVQLLVSSTSHGALAALAAPRAWVLLVRSLVLASGTTAVAFAIGVPIGVLVARTDVPFRNALWLAHAVPLFLPPFLPALGWFHWFKAEGVLGNAHTSALLFSELGVVVVLGLTLAPVVTSLTALGVLGIERSLQEAAQATARPWRIATRILLPGAAPAIALSTVVVFTLSLSELGVPMFLRVEVFPTAVFAHLGGADFAPGEAFALALPLLALGSILLFVERRLAGSQALGVLGWRRAALVPMQLRHWRLPATAACSAAAALSLAPVLALFIAARHAWARVPEWAGAAPWNGLLSGTIAATLVTAIAVVAGHAIARKLPGARLLDMLCMVGLITPAAVLGVGMMALWNRPETQAIYGTVLIVAFGFVARYAIVGVRVMASAVRQSSVHFEEAAAASGATFARRLLRIVVPLHGRGILFAWLLTLVFCLRDLETAVLFYPPGYEPLTVRIFTLEANGPPAIVAGLSVLHVLITAAVLTVALVIVKGARR